MDINKDKLKTGGMDFEGDYISEEKVQVAFNYYFGKDIINIKLSKSEEA